LKGEKAPQRIEVRTRLDFLPMSEDQARDGVGAFIPRVYMSESRQRIEAYRRLAEVNEEKELKVLAEEWKDRFGKFPPPVARLLDLARVRLAAAGAGVSSVEVEEGKVMLRRGGSLIMIGSRLPRLTSAATDKRLQEIIAMIRELGSSK
jgi:transcription-repair coupling factor (superfamily II helicase)